MIKKMIDMVYKVIEMVYKNPVRFFQLHLLYVRLVSQYQVWSYSEKKKWNLWETWLTWI